MAYDPGNHNVSPELGIWGLRFIGEDVNVFFGPSVTRVNKRMANVKKLLIVNSKNIEITEDKSELPGNFQ